MLKSDEAALTRPEFWDGLYNRVPAGPHAGWLPRSYDHRLLARELAARIRHSKPRRIVEVGCGNSLLLAWLGRVSGAEVTGIDYSPHGCILMRALLDQAGITGRIICADLFSPPPTELGRHDLVYSLGLIEHFTVTSDALAHLTALVAPGGTVVTIVPNLSSFHGWLARLWQPRHAHGYRCLTRAQLLAAYQSLNLLDIRSRYLGLFSLDVVAWETDPAWPRLAKILLPVIRLAYRFSNRILNVINAWRGTPSLAPFIAVVGRRPWPVTSTQPL